MTTPIPNNEVDLPDYLHGLETDCEDRINAVDSAIHRISRGITKAFNAAAACDWNGGITALESLQREIGPEQIKAIRAIADEFEAMLQNQGDDSAIPAAIQAFQMELESERREKEGF